MDSLTQITLGAAMGELALGKKIGNRAMIWGAIGGTIPDLDVLANLVTDDFSATAFHRAITHSLFFSLLMPLALGWLAYHTYQKSNIQNQSLLQQSWWLKWLLVWLLLFVVSTFGANVLPIPKPDTIKIGMIVSLAIVFPFVLTHLYRMLRKPPLLEQPPTMIQWSILFFLSIITHPLIDTCTTYGTQLLQPFSNIRASTHNISVIDPLYTVPFLVCLIIASFFSRTHSYRAIFGWLGFGLSSAYLAFTFYNKAQVNAVYKTSLTKNKIEYQGLLTTPTIGNNILWQGIAESDSVYYHAMYSILDQQPEINRFTALPKNHHLLLPFEAQREVAITKWLSNGWYNVIELPNNHLQINQLRYGSFKPVIESPNDYLFSTVFKIENDKLISVDRSFNREDISWEVFWNRLKGI